jgi:hypothetical protein
LWLGWRNELLTRYRQVFSPFFRGIHVGADDEQSLKALSIGFSFHRRLEMIVIKKAANGI